MTTKVTIKDIAKGAGVSHATVSMVFSGEKRISEKTRNKVLTIAKRMNYVPNIGARNLRRGASKLIGFVLNDISNPVYGKMAQFAEAIAIANGYEVIIADHQWDPEREYNAIQKMISFRARGLLWCSTERNEAAQQLMNSPGGPSVVALDSCPRHYTGSFLGYDVESTGRMAAKHLLESGCKNPVLFSANRTLKGIRSFEDLETGFLGELQKQGVRSMKNRVIYSGLTTEEGCESFHRMRSTTTDVDGVFSVNDLCAYGVMGGADEVGLKIGVDLALIGIGNNSMSSIPRISLTSIGHSPEQIVRLAMEELVDSFAQDRLPSLRLSLPGELIIRGSSRLVRKN